MCLSPHLPRRISNLAPFGKPNLQSPHQQCSFSHRSLNLRSIRQHRNTPISILLQQQLWTIISTCCCSTHTPRNLKRRNPRLMSNNPTFLTLILGSIQNNSPQVSLRHQSPIAEASSKSLQVRTTVRLYRTSICLDRIQIDPRLILNYWRLLQPRFYLN